MADTKKEYLDYTGLQEYHTKIKTLIGDEIDKIPTANHTLRVNADNSVTLIIEDN